MRNHASEGEIRDNIGPSMCLDFLCIGKEKELKARICCMKVLHAVFLTCDIVYGAIHGFDETDVVFLCFGTFWRHYCHGAFLRSRRRESDSRQGYC